jgi:hypothetical protein
MQLTITQNEALYLAARRISKDRRSFFQRFRAVADKQRPDIRRRLNPLEGLVAPRYHRDNGR